MGNQLFLLKPGFEDPEKPGRFFVCPHCNAIEGLPPSFLGLATQIEVHRLPYRKPRESIVSLLGEANQSLPVLVFDHASSVPDDAEIANGHRFIDSIDRILDLSAEHYSFPSIHS